MLRLLLFLTVTVAIISGVLGSKYIRYGRTGSGAAYYSSSGGGALAGYVIAGLIGVILICAAIYFLVKYCNKKKRLVTPRPQRGPPGSKFPGSPGPTRHTGPRRIVEPPPYPGLAPPPTGLSTSTSVGPPPGHPPPSYTQAVAGQGPGEPPASNPAFPPAPVMPPASTAAATPAAGNTTTAAGNTNKAAGNTA